MFSQASSSCSTQLCAVCPQILLQVQAMSTTPPAERYASARDALWRIPAREGWAALWRGNGANVLRLVPDVGLKFALNDQMRLLFAPADGRPMGLDGKLAAGAATGVLKTVSCTGLVLTRARQLTCKIEGRGGQCAHSLEPCRACARQPCAPGRLQCPMQLFIA